MMDQQMQQLAERVERLERQNRRFKVAALGAALVIAAGVVMAATAPAPRVITAHSFKVVGYDGRVLGTFGERPSDYGAAALVLYNDKGRPSLKIEEEEDCLYLPKCAATMSSHYPELKLFDDGGTPRVVLSLTADFSAKAQAAVPNPFGKVNAPGGPLYTPGGTPVLQFYGNDAALAFNNSYAVPFTTLALGTDEHGYGGAVFFDAKHEVRLSLGKSELYLRAGGQLSTEPASWRRPSTKVSLPESSIAAFDKEGNLLAQWPSP